MLKSISIIIPVYNELQINYYLDNLLSKIDNYGKHEIIIVDGDPSGSTLKLINSDEIYGFCANRGRSVQQNFGASKATNDILLFLHSDTILPRDFCDLISFTINSGYDVGAFDLEIDSNHKVLKYFSKVASIRSRITKHPYGDQAQFFRRDKFEKIGGFPDIVLMEDIAIMQLAKKNGLKVKILNQKVLTSDRKYLKDGIFFGLVRNPILATLFYLGVSPNLLYNWYYRIK